MRSHSVALTCFAVLIAAAIPAMAHCTVDRSNPYIRGDYQGECDESTELAQGQGEAAGADRYTGYFAKGKPDGKGTYAWANGARLEGSFKAGRATGPGVYVSSNGTRYEGPFDNGKLNGAKS